MMCDSATAIALSRVLEFCVGSISASPGFPIALALPIGTRPPRSGSLNVAWPSPPNVVPRMSPS